MLLRQPLKTSVLRYSLVAQMRHVENRLIRKGNIVRTNRIEAPQRPARPAILILTRP
jgi:hypothetical protein